MDIPRNDMLPDESQTQPEVSEDLKTQTFKVEDSEDEPQLETTPVTEVSKTPEKVVRTPENELLAALKEERKRRRELEDKLKEAESSSVTSEFLDDDSLSIEGKILKKQLENVNSKLARLEKEREEEKVHSMFPQLKDKSEEFETFREDYPSVPYEKVAKLFLSENNLLETKTSRKGLEKPTGGEKRQDTSGISASDVDRLMKNQPRKFIEMVRSGKIKAEDIK